ncbi:hypothetical protein Q787_01380 [Ornithobacterium rhinotracheale H06-030791]|uniref:Uncharacterized protein n=1 Tax=Ornithobacterium rhinotracheale (strain ATCC 51463 / DSM 15997 / CCUG 23171 / CIP 104009 / LMG 9086) TaxID=867902 RepID=I3ZXP7_ORNRL|nr:hypothetical protein Ornrh_0259 [Ornithobacterium rhinotracheale DSM 15997]AIQ00282.1 hypothetical protein Q785_01415 [Ornithobacterium rhinotracheale ORT-UMN 88]KGB67832.1 hypothetical protein Q787_01380 [Ornithobacterium rhinotracheale H06-030791]
MPKENISPELLKSWQSKLEEITKNSKIEFEIKTLEEFIK